MAKSRRDPFAGCVSHAERFQSTHIRQCKAEGRELCLAGPVPHDPPKAARKAWPTAAQVLADIARAQKRVGPQLYVGPNPFQVQR
jgi:hypothetical protein